jgi:hypothetical protein
MKEVKSLDGVISHLARKYDGNVHAKGFVTVGPKPVHDDPEYAGLNVADLSSESPFASNFEQITGFAEISTK